MTPAHCAAYKVDKRSMEILCECDQMTKETLMKKNQVNLLVVLLCNTLEL